jgi:outer membrane protein assembly factor BamC
MISSIRVLLLFILSLFIFSGCSDKPITLGDIAGIGDDFAEIFGKDDSKDYGDSESIAKLEIPPSLDNPDYSDSLIVPKSIGVSGEIVDFSDAPVLPSYIDMKIFKEGIARWLEIQSNPISLWPYINQFWIAQGFEIKTNEPVNGILETRWKKSEISFATDSSLLNNEDFNYNITKEKFRVRVERQPNGHTNIYLSNHILEADNVVDKTKILWKRRDSDITREAEMLVRMMEYFGNSRDEALVSLKDSEKDEQKIFIDLIDFYGAPAIIIEDSFSKIWREIGLSLDRSGLLVQDFNRDKEVYVITTDIIEGKEVSYEIKLTKRKEQYLVTVHKHNTKTVISYNAARNILKHILAAYGSSVAKK